jgi:hypothetical protein
MKPIPFGLDVVWLLTTALDAQDRSRREQIIFFRSSDKVGHAATRRAKIGSEGICVPPCVP